MIFLVALVAGAGWATRNTATDAWSQKGPRHVASTQSGDRQPAAGQTGSTTGGSGSAAGAGAGQPAAAGTNGVTVGQSYKNDVSPPLRTIKPNVSASARKDEDNENPPIVLQGAPNQVDTVVQRSFGVPGSTTSPSMPAPIANWAGIGSRGSGGGGCNCIPPDTNGDVGPNHYVQVVNAAFQIWNKSGTSQYGPAAINTVWSGFGGVCETQNDGDPIVLYDPIANRWLISQFTANVSPYNQCIAISSTPDPTGPWYRYAFEVDHYSFEDYPHLGVWPDGYYMSVNQFDNFGMYGGPRPYVFERTRMLAGQPATFQSFPAMGSSVPPMLPSDLDGPALPPAGAPNYFAMFGNPLNIYKFHVDWASPANSYFNNSASPSTAPFTQACTLSLNCIPQPATPQLLDGIADRLMHRVAYRNLGDHESLVLNHSVDVGSGQLAPRWYEIRNPGTSPIIYQQGSYAPDGTNRWMGSAAMDRAGNIAIGYSASSSSVYPSIRYAGRLSSDPLGVLGQGETTLFAGTGSQWGVRRWGDYSAMTVDPTDDCTFWYTSEYNNSYNWYWQTRIGSFKFPSCGSSGPTATATATAMVTATATPAPPTNTPTGVPPTTPTPVNVPDFTLSVTPPTQTVIRGGSTTYTVSLTSTNGFNGNVNLTVSGLPNQMSATFSPNPVTLSAGSIVSSTFTINTGRRGSVNSYTLTITGSGGGRTHSQNVTLVVSR